MSIAFAGVGVALVLIGVNLNFFAAHRWNEHHMTGIAAAIMVTGGLLIGRGAW